MFYHSLGFFSALTLLFTSFALAQEDKKERVSTPPSIQSSGPVQSAASLAEYRLAVGDTIRLIVFGNADVSGTFEVGQDGTVVLPLLAQTPAEGRTAKELEKHITAALDKDYLVDPNISIEVLKYRPIYILGQVENPGSYDYEVGLDVRQAVALAGGFTSRANRESMKLIRKQGDAPQEIKANPTLTVLPGDTIEINRRWF